MSVVNVKEVYFDLENGILTPIFVLEDGRIIEGWYTPDGSGWDLYFRFKEPQYVLSKLESEGGEEIDAETARKLLRERRGMR
jgi:hypothetical protein